jgi:hypothetical protein
VAAGVLLALDLQLVIDFARVVTEADASGVIQKINPLRGIDARKIAAFRNAV